VRGIPRRMPAFFAIALFSLFFLWLPAGAAGLPQPGGEFYINDGAALLSQGTKEDILAKNQELYNTYGVQLVVYTVDALPAEGYAGRVAYLRSLLDSWQVGGPQGNGMILALSVGDGDYLAVSGQGLRAQLTSENLKSLLDTHLEADFSVGSYDAGVAKFFSACAAQVEAFCAQNPALFSGPPQGVQPESSGASAVRLGQEEGAGLGALVWVLIGAGAVVVVCVLLFFRAGQARRRRSRRTVHGGRARLLHPSNASPVIRNETRPTVQVKRSSQQAGTYRSSARGRGDRL